MKIRQLLIPIALLITMPAMSQELWTSAAFKASFNKHWNTTAEVEYRTSDNLKSSDRVTAGIRLDYKHTYFKIDAGYKFMRTHTDLSTTNKGNIIPAFWLSRHRAYASVTGKINIGRFELSLRERYQFTHRVGKFVPKFDSNGVKPKDDEWIDSRDRHILRSRIECDYKIRKSRFTPFCSVEIYDNLSEQFDVEKVRYTLGSEYSINKHNTVELFYRFNQGVAAGEPNANVIGLGYTYKL